METAIRAALLAVLNPLDHDIPYMVHRICGLLEEELGVSRSIQRSVEKNIKRKTKILETHMKAFEESLYEEVKRDLQEMEEKLVKPLVGLVQMYKAGQGQSVKEHMEYFEKMLSERLTPETDAGSVDSSNAA